MPGDLLGAIGAYPPSHVGALTSRDALSLPPANPTETGKSFGDFLVDAIGDVNDLQQKASDTVSKFAAGAPMDIHQVMIAGEEASTALALTTQVRNKLVDAYTEIIHTQM